MSGYPVRGDDKFWSILYGIIDKDGNQWDENNDIVIEARSIDEALRLAYDRLYHEMYSQHWQAFKIWDIGICNDNIW